MITFIYMCIQHMYDKQPVSSLQRDPSIALILLGSESYSGERSYCQQHFAISVLFNLEPNVAHELFHVQNASSVVQVSSRSHSNNSEFQ